MLLTLLSILSVAYAHTLLPKTTPSDDSDAIGWWYYWVFYSVVFIVPWMIDWTNAPLPRQHYHQQYLLTHAAAAFLEQEPFFHYWTLTLTGDQLNDDIIQLMMMVGDKPWRTSDSGVITLTIIEEPAQPTRLGWTTYYYQWLFWWKAYLIETDRPKHYYNGIRQWTRMTCPVDCGVFAW